MGAWGGFANLYWTFSSVAAGPIVLLNDLFVVESRRGAGIGRRLIEFSLRRAEERGASRLEWRTELDNRVASAALREVRRGADRVVHLRALPRLARMSTGGHAACSSSEHAY